MANNDKKDTDDGFDKFMYDICKKEDAAKSRAKIMSEQKNDSPRRRYNELYRERWQNRIKWEK